VRSAAATAIITTVFAVAPSTRAESHAEPVLHYEADEGCPDALAFRAEALDHARPGEEARVFDVTLERGEGGFRGRLVVTSQEGVVLSREIMGATCREAARALSLAVALALDPRTDEAPAIPPLAFPTASVPSPPQPEPLLHAMRFEPVAREREAAGPAAPSLPVRAWRVGLSADGNVTTFLPQPLYGAAVRLELGLAGWLARGGFEYDETSSLQTTYVGARVRRVLASLEVCREQSIVPRLALVPCLRGEAGNLGDDSTTEVAVQNEPPSRTWLALGLGGGARYEVTRPLFASLEGVFLLPLGPSVWPRYYGGDLDLPRTAWHLALGVGARFP
jgi:hypothetical protein